MIHVIPRALLQDVWGKVEPMLAEALEYHPFMDTQGILQRLFAGAAELILVLDDTRLAGCVVMEQIAYPSHRIGNLLALAGEAGSMARFDDEVERFLETWCRERRLDSLAMLGRPGWSRVLEARGWRVQPMCTAWKPINGILVESVEDG